MAYNYFREAAVRNQMNGGAMYSHYQLTGIRGYLPVNTSVGIRWEFLGISSILADIQYGPSEHIITYSLDLHVFLDLNVTKWSKRTLCRNIGYLRLLTLVGRFRRGIRFSSSET